MMRNDDTHIRALALVHALYFLIGGAWAVTGKRTFEAVTGPKVDYWLVRTVGGLLSVAGVVLALAPSRGAQHPCAFAYAAKEGGPWRARWFASL